LYQPQPGALLRLLRTSIPLIILVLGIACLSAALPSSSLQPPRQSLVPAVTLALPRQQIWKQGVSSFLFGTNDTQEWYHNNVETNPAIQQDLKDAHFTLMRTFFFDKSLADNHPTTDVEIEQRLKTIENSGMVCLGVLVNPVDIAFAEHVVRYAGKRCQIYEFGNEPDTQDIDSAYYLKLWNEAIPILRHINPSARFIGPVVGVDDYLRAFLAGVKQSGVLPDAVSFHWYPCWHDSEATCLGKASAVAQKVLTARAWVKELLGKDLPIGVTEWNFDPGIPPAAYGNNPDFMTRFTVAALQAMIHSGVAFACQFDAASATVYLDMFDYRTGQPRPQYYAIKALIQQYRV
jgi:hypothetical protein